MNGLFQNAFLYIIERTIEGACAVMFHMLKYVPPVHGVDDEAVDIKAYPLTYVPDRFKTQGMRIKQLRRTHGNSWMCQTTVRPLKCVKRECAEYHAH